MGKIKDTLFDLAVIIFWAVCSLLMLPYLLLLAWVNTILLKKETRGLDFDLRGSE